jgi:hypothetical protein
MFDTQTTPQTMPDYVNNKLAFGSQVKFSLSAKLDRPMLSGADVNPPCVSTTEANQQSPDAYLKALRDNGSPIVERTWSGRTAGPSARNNQMRSISPSAQKGRYSSRSTRSSARADGLINDRKMVIESSQSDAKLGQLDSMTALQHRRHKRFVFDVSPIPPPTGNSFQGEKATTPKVFDPHLVGGEQYMFTHGGFTSGRKHGSGRSKNGRSASASSHRSGDHLSPRSVRLVPSY